MLTRRGLPFIFAILFAVLPAQAKEQSALELEPIVVTQSGSLATSGYSVRYRDPQYWAFEFPLESLKLLPIDMEERSLSGSSQTRFSLRGSTTRGVLMLLDGQRINDPQTEYYNSDIPFTKEDIRRIDILPSGASRTAGPDAIGGAVSIALKKPEADKKVLELGYGSHDAANMLLSLSQKMDTFSTRVSVESHRDRGFSYDTDSKGFIISSVSWLEVPAGDINLSAGYQEKEYGAYDFYTPGKGNPSREWTRTYLLKSDADFKGDGFLIKPSMLWRRHYDKFMLDETSTSSNHHRSDIYTPAVYLEKETAAVGTLGLSLEYGEERMNSTNLGKHNRNHKSLALSDKVRLGEKISLDFSLRRDDFDGFGDAYYGSANARFRVSEYGSLFMGASRDIRIPSFTELYYDYYDTVGDAGLAAEKSLSCELGYDYSREGLKDGVKIFYRDENDLIDWVWTDSTQRWQAQNIGVAKVMGAECYFNVRASKILSFNLNYTYINKKFKEQDYIFKYGPNYARHIFNGSFNLNTGRVTSMFWVLYKKKPLRSGWWLLGVCCDYRLNEKAVLFFRATNLLNVDYQEIEGIPQPGRYLEGGLRIEW